MNEKSEQLEALLSRCLDDDLTAEEQARIRRAIAEDSEAATTAKRYERLNQILRSYRPLPGGLDWRVFFQNVSDRIDEARSAEESAKLDNALDDSLENWTKPLPDIDWDAFKARVSAAVHQEAAATHATAARRPAMVRWFAPLAAAAAIALTVWWYPWTETEVDDPSRSIVVVALDMPTDDRQISISFDETPVDPGQGDDFPVGSSAIAVGPGRIETGDAFDEAYFY